MLLIFILLAVFVASVLSLFGGVIILVKNKGEFDLEKNMEITAFAAGALLATAFFDLIPEAISEMKDVSSFSLWFFFGVVTLFMLEKTLLWYHNHHEPHDSMSPAVWLITIGDSIHNFLDGVAISAAFLTNPTLGFATTLAVFLHEIPHELVDFGILLSHGAGRARTLVLNLVSSLTALLGAILMYWLSTRLSSSIPIILAFAAGNFLYITLADLIPELNSRDPSKQKTVKQIMMFTFGVALILGFKRLIP